MIDFRRFSLGFTGNADDLGITKACSDSCLKLSFATLSLARALADSIYFNPFSLIYDFKCILKNKVFNGKCLIENILCCKLNNKSEI